MASDMEQINGLLGPLRMRMFINRMLEGYAQGMFVASVLSLLLSLLALFLPFTFDWITVVQCIVLSMAIVTAMCAMAFPDAHEVHRVADAYGLHERLMTSFAFSQRHTPMVLLQRGDTFEHVAQLEFSKLCPVKIPLKKLGLAVLIFGIAVSLSFIETDARSQAAQMQKMQAQAIEGIEALRKLVNEVNLLSDLSAEQKKVFGQKLETIQNELQKARTQEEFQKVLLRGENEANTIQESLSGNSFTRLSQEFAKYDSTKGLAEALQRFDVSTIEKEMQKAGQAIQQMSPEERKKMADALKQLSKDIQNHPSLGDALQRFSQALADSSENLEKAMVDLGKTMAEAAQKDKELNEALQEISHTLSQRLKNTLANTRDKMGIPPSGNSKPATAGQKQQAPATEQAPVNPEGQPSERNGLPGSQNGEQPGSNNGQNNNEQSFGTTRQGSQAGGSEGKEIPYAPIYTPKRIGGDAAAQHVQGQTGSDGSSRFSPSQSNQTARGSVIPYNKVFAEYNNEAVEALDSDTIPAPVKDLVKEYFNALDE